MFGAVSRFKKITLSLMNLTNKLILIADSIIHSFSKTSYTCNSYLLPRLFIRSFTSLLISQSPFESWFMNSVAYTTNSSNWMLLLLSASRLRKIASQYSSVRGKWIWKFSKKLFKKPRISFLSREPLLSVSCSLKYFYSCSAKTVGSARNCVIVSLKAGLASSGIAITTASVMFYCILIGEY